MKPDEPRVLVFSHLFPSPGQPTAGVFVRERMFRVAKQLPLVVLAPQPWFPFQSIIRLFRPHFRTDAPRFEVMQGIEIHRPRVLCFPGILKWTDGFFMAVGSYLTARRLVKLHHLNLIDAHFGYPDGYAATLLARWLRLPMMLTLRGKEERQLTMDVAGKLREAILGADRIVCVSDALRQVALKVGADPARVNVIGNGVDLSKFQPIARDEARRALSLPEEARVIVSVGTLVERKGFHRVIEVLPRLLLRFPDLYFLIVGGAGPEGDMSGQIRAQIGALGLTGRVRLLGSYQPDQLKYPLSAADAFVLATRYEGWANVFLEAMACGLPVVTTRVGGNEQVVGDDAVGRVVEFGDSEALAAAISEALTTSWDRARVRAYAERNSWEARIPLVVAQLRGLLEERSAAGVEAAAFTSQTRMK